MPYPVVWDGYVKTTQNVPWLDEVDGFQCGAGMRCECQDNEEEEVVILEIAVRYH